MRLDSVDCGMMVVVLQHRLTGFPTFCYRSCWPRGCSSVPFRPRGHFLCGQLCGVASALSAIAVPFKGTAESLTAVGVSPCSAIQCALRPAMLCGILVLSPGKGSVFWSIFFSPVPGFLHVQNSSGTFLCPIFADTPSNECNCVRIVNAVGGRCQNVPEMCPKMCPENRYGSRADSYCLQRLQKIG